MSRSHAPGMGARTSRESERGRTSRAGGAVRRGVRSSSLRRRALETDERRRLDRDAGRLRRARRKNGRLAERAGGLVMNRRRQRLPRRTDGGPGRERGNRHGRLRACGHAHGKGQGEQEQPDHATQSHRRKGEHVVPTVQALGEFRVNIGAPGPAGMRGDGAGLRSGLGRPTRRVTPRALLPGSRETRSRR